MKDTLLSTKLFIPPLQTNSVNRHRLIKRLDAGLNHKLTLISAPAGFGKTTLVSSWIDNLETGSGKDLANPKHPDHHKEYVQGYLTKSVTGRSHTRQPNLQQQLL